LVSAIGIIYYCLGRLREGKEVTVGRFTCTLKMVGDYMNKYEYFDGTNLTGPKKALS
jgi:hypothetical protein